MASSTPYQVTAALNNHGVACFQCGDLPNALDLFRRALQSTIGNIQPVQEQPVPKAGLSSPSMSSSSTPMSSSASGSSNNGVCPPSSGNAQQREDSPQMSIMHAYTRMINLIPSDGAYAHDPLVNATIVSAIILFNLALVYHVKGMESGCLYDNASQARLLKARSLYIKVRTLLTEAGISSTMSTGNPVIDILTMAVFNNLGQTAYYLSEFCQSQTHFEDLIAYVNTVNANEEAQAAADKPSQQQDHETVALLEWHKSLFRMNAVTLQAPTLASAA